MTATVAWREGAEQRGHGGTNTGLFPFPLMNRPANNVSCRAAVKEGEKRMKSNQ